MKIQPAIDTSAISSIEVMPPKLVPDRQTEQHEADANGEPLSSVEEVCIGREGGEILSVGFPGTPSAGIRQGMAVKVAGLMISDWSIGDRSGSRSGPVWGLCSRTQKLAVKLGSRARLA
jgi:hypothetical protein